ncbi:hypothetical protein SULI_09345 [Saccharolobus solfataricus]|uniref:Uncharacterized protein n=2 Tax=Saccharolobus solfataricus TaxID=2287 RepID=A0A0E3MDP2_SACSO|nr:hypothetical protein [Saccharolobus solfataricus]AKA74090.1 hypothetical protein SULB_1861 [Saccharolobus solfataricus]AKA76788.1 hypothetical protein SULC_1859 [Saccharolobus solfataricus]AKA79481.1 hypothetical protein SULA_1860 [Saccharolobus solfataricus]AZF68569.1 hypothetical protein SULG_09345 [Saccharolobus solfataricus]AZF71189.1 hypothetical protein SULH_09345 [Saccharolobus solfataricus]
MKILYILIKNGDMNITKLYRLSKIHYDKLRRELEDLQKMDLIEVIGSDKKIVRLNYSNPKVVILINLLEELDKNEFRS